MKQLQETHRYDDIIEKKHPVSSRHAAMTNRDRAVQFAPFAALTGYDEVIKEASRLTTPRIELEESERQLLDQKLQYLYNRVDEQPEVEITYFEPDAHKSGGTYRTVRACVKKIDLYRSCVLLVGGQRIPMGEIIRILL